MHEVEVLLSGAVEDDKTTGLIRLESAQVTDRSLQRVFEVVEDGPGGAHGGGHAGAAKTIQ